MSEQFYVSPIRDHDDNPNIIRDKVERLADAEQWNACRDDLMTVSISLAPLLALYPGVKQDLQAAIDRCTLNIEGKIGRSFVEY
jgi:hypothetical protein